MTKTFEDFLTDKDKKFYVALTIGDDLESPMSKHASKVFYYGAMLAESEVAMNRAEAAMDRVEKQLTRSFRTSDKNDKIKSTESQYSERAQTHQLFIKAQDHYFDLKKLHLMVKAKYKAQLEKGIMLQQLAQHRRKELDAGIRSKLKKSSE
jgi:hypothetical protein